MTTTFKLLLASLLLAAGAGLAQASQSPPASPARIELAAMPSPAPVAQATTRLAWQRVGSPVREV